MKILVLPPGMLVVRRLDSPVNAKLINFYMADKCYLSRFIV
jgi:hypothetical protein